MEAMEAMDHDAYSDTFIRGVLSDVKSIAMVGASANWNRPSFFAMKYLLQKGYRVHPINPAADGARILNQTVYADLEDVPAPVDMVDIFRPASEAGAIVDEAIRLAPEKGIRVVWMQLGVRDDAAAARAEAAGLTAVMNRCPKIEYARLYGELGWNGFNSGVISSKRRRIGER